MSDHAIRHRYTDEQVSVAQQVTDRKADRDRLAAYFKAHPMRWLKQADIARETGIAEGSLRTRKGECKRQLAMNIEKLHTSFIGTDGIEHRGLDEWRYLPHEPLGRSAETIVSGQATLDLR